MTDQIVYTFRKDHISEGSRLPVTARFRDRATAADVTPTNVYYRINCLTTGVVILDWTSVTPGTEVIIAITPTQNTLQNQCNVRERKQLIVAADYGLSTQYTEPVEYTVENLCGVS